jgi:hypothetical protein
MAVFCATLLIPASRFWLVGKARPGPSFNLYLLSLLSLLFPYPGDKDNSDSKPTACVTFAHVVQFLWEPDGTLNPIANNA